MKYSQNSHPGNLPIRVLQHNVIAHFENFKPYVLAQLEKWVDSGLIHPGIDWIIEENKIKSPFANCSTKKIAIQEVFLAYIWAFSYALVVIYEQGIQKKAINGTWNGIIDFDTKLLQDAKRLLEWAISLTNSFSPWDNTLPNPECYSTEEEQWYGEKVNGIFLNSIVFIMRHESCHLVNGHCDFIKGLKGRSLLQLTPIELAQYKMLENEADNFAMESLVSDSDNEKDKLEKGLAMLLANLSILFILKNPKEVSSPTHPDVDTRIHNLLEYVGEDLPKFDYLWYLACFACNMFFDYHQIEVNKEMADTSIQLFSRYLKIFEEIKG